MLTQTARDVMTRDVVTIRKGSTVEEALTIMAERNVSGLPVVDVDGCLQGIVTESDVLLKGQFTLSASHPSPSKIAQARVDGLEEAYRRAKAALVEEAMTTRVLTFAQDSLVVDIARAMMENGVNRVPIVENCKVVGIVSRRDVIKAMAKAANGVNGDRSDEMRSGRVIEL